MNYEYNSLKIRQKCLFSKNVFIQILQHIFFYIYCLKLIGSPFSPLYDAIPLDSQYT